MIRLVVDVPAALRSDLIASFEKDLDAAEIIVPLLHDGPTATQSPTMAYVRNSSDRNGLLAEMSRTLTHAVLTDLQLTDRRVVPSVMLRAFGLRAGSRIRLPSGFALNSAPRDSFPFMLHLGSSPASSVEPDELPSGQRLVQELVVAEPTEEFDLHVNAPPGRAPIEWFLLGALTP